MHKPEHTPGFPTEVLIDAALNRRYWANFPRKKSSTPKMRPDRKTKKKKRQAEKRARRAHA